MHNIDIFKKQMEKQMFLDQLLGWKYGKLCQQGLLDCFVESIDKLNLNTLNSWIPFILMINNKKFFDFIV
jgi:hypothetical protein